MTIEVGKIAGIIGSGAVGAIVTVFALTGATHVGRERTPRRDDVTHPTPQYRVDGKERKVMVRRSTDLSFHVDMIVGRTPITALVDTGANITVLTREDAVRAGIPDGLNLGSTDVKGIAKATRQYRNVGRMPIRFGPIIAWDVPVSIDDSGELQNSILGQDAICNMKKVTIENDTLTFMHDSPVVVGCSADFVHRIALNEDPD
jgi:clan AA aspartic protease (TIGR02281 family)